MAAVKNNSRTFNEIFAFAPYGRVFIIMQVWKNRGIIIFNTSTKIIPTKAQRISKLGMAMAITTEAAQPKRFTKARAVDTSQSSKNIKLLQSSKFSWRGLMASANSLP